MNKTTPVSEALRAQGVPHRLFWHSGPIRSLEQAAAERGQVSEQIVRSLVFRIARDEFLMVLMAGPTQVSWAGLRRHLGLSRMTMARPEEVLVVTGYPRGAVSPFGLPRPMRILVDESVVNAPFEELSLGSGVRGVAVVIHKADLLAALGNDMEVVRLADTTNDGPAG